MFVSKHGQMCAQAHAQLSLAQWVGSVYVDIYPERPLGVLALESVAPKERLRFRAHDVSSWRPVHGTCLCTGAMLRCGGLMHLKAVEHGVESKLFIPLIPACDENLVQSSRIEQLALLLCDLTTSGHLDSRNSLVCIFFWEPFQPLDRLHLVQRQLEHHVCILVVGGRRHATAERNGAQSHGSGQ